MLCKAANIAVESESSFCFNKSTRKRMDLVINIDNRDILIDATTIDTDNPSNGFILGTDLSPSYSLEQLLHLRLGLSSENITKSSPLIRSLSHLL